MPRLLGQHCSLMLSECVTLGVLRVGFECRATALLFSDRLGPLLGKGDIPKSQALSIIRRV